MNKKKLSNLQTILEKLQPYAIAFSGGNDSLFLVKISQEFSFRFCAIHCISEFTIPYETRTARTFAKNSGIKYYEVHTSVLDRYEIVSNTKDRCYYCKRHIFKKIYECAKTSGFLNIVDGSNVSDSVDFRPGMRVLKELDIHSPLMEAGITKDEILHGLKHFNMEYRRASNSCLATRIPYTITITKDILNTVRKAENFLLSLGFEGVRVRYHYPIARIEVLKDDITKIVEPAKRAKIIVFFKKLGFIYVTIDLEGFNSGNLNKVW